MFKIVIHAITSNDQGGAVAEYRLTGWLPFAPSKGLLIKAKSLRGEMGLVKIDTVSWVIDTTEGWSGYFEVIAATEEETVFDHDEFNAAFTDRGWHVTLKASY